MKLVNSTLAVTGIIFLLLNFYATAALPLEVSRWMRILSSVSFSVLYIIFAKKREKRLSLVFVLLIITDVLLLKFDFPYIRLIYIILMIFSYLILIGYVLPYIRNLRTNFFQVGMLLFIIPINIFLILLVMDLAGDKISGVLHASFFFLYGIIIMLLGIAAFSFNFRYSSKASFFFVCSMFSFIICDIAGFISYYVHVDEFYYPGRGFYILGLMTLVKYTSLERNKISAADSEIL